MFTPVKQYPRDNRHSMSYNKHVRNAKRVRSRRNSDRKASETAAFLRSHGKAQNAAACDNDNRESLSDKSQSAFVTNIRSPISAYRTKRKTQADDFACYDRASKGARVPFSEYRRIDYGGIFYILWEINRILIRI